MAINDTTAPTGYAMTLTTDFINASNQTAFGLSITGAEVDTIYDYSITSSGGGTPVTGTGTVTAASFSITSINVSGLNDGTLTVSFKLTDRTGNAGAPYNVSLSKSILAPYAPTNVTGVPGNSQVALSWTAPTNIGASAITNHYVKYSTDSGNTWSTPALTGSNATSFTVTGLTNGANHIFKVSAVNTQASGPYSASSLVWIPDVWEDVTTTAAAAPSSCAADTARCSMRTNSNGLWWSKIQNSSNWDSATSYCASLNYNGQTGWRLPTLEEWQGSYSRGITFAASTDWISLASMADYFWTSSLACGGNPVSAWSAYLSTGEIPYWLAGACSADKMKSNLRQVVCVRP